LRGEINYDKILPFLESLILNGLNHVNITGGEPTLYTQFYKLVNELLDRDIYVTITTNGLTDFSQKNLVSVFNRIDKLRVRFSLDGSKKIHENLRGASTFEKTINGLKMLSNQQVWVAVNTVVYKNTISDLPYLYDELKSIRFDEWALITPVDSKNNLDFNSFFSKEYETLIYNLHNGKKQLVSLGYTGQIHLIDFYSNPNAYLFVDEMGTIILPGTKEEDDIIVSHLDSYKLYDIQNTVEQVIASNTKTYFDW
jgi:sulfatase maturation enzyme AslB (radical SAM superfamily)